MHPGLGRDPAHGHLAGKAPVPSRAHGTPTWCTPQVGHVTRGTRTLRAAGLHVESHLPDGPGRLQAQGPAKQLMLTHGASSAAVTYPHRTVENQ